MLFDLKGKRKRLVQVVYVILAVLFGGSLVLFGVGSDAPGGLVDAITGNNSGGSINTDQFERDVDRAQAKARANPKDPTAWAQVAQTELALARAGDDYDTETGQFKEGAVDRVERATQAWERHLKLKPKRPDANLALFMVQAYATLLRFGRGDPLREFEAAADAQEIYAKARPSPNAWFELASILYQFGKIERADRAADEALALTPRDQRNVVQSQIDDLRKDGIKIKREIAKSEEQAEKAAREARKSGQDPFGAAPGQTSLGQ